MMEEEGGDSGYRWEGNYEKTWELLQETESGLVDSTAATAKREKRRLLQQRLSNVKLGVMRHLFLILDQSQNMEDTDLKPCRFICVRRLAEAFVLEFYDQNPISQIGVITGCAGKGCKVSELSSNINKHVARLGERKGCEGQFSLFNTLQLAHRTLTGMPTYASREVLIVAGSLTSVDPRPVVEIIGSLVEANIRVSVIGLSASVQLFGRVAAATGGSYHVMLDEQHLQELLRLHCTPPTATPTMEPTLVRMGFPPHSAEGALSLCQCHVEESPRCELSTRGFTCPTCKSRYCEVPVECRLCSLTLVCAPHLARSYHHLFPLHLFTEIAREPGGSCEGCGAVLGEQAYQCGECNQLFCYTCDLFIHDMLHHCPGCEARG